MDMVYHANPEGAVISGLLAGAKYADRRCQRVGLPYLEANIVQELDVIFQLSFLQCLSLLSLSLCVWWISVVLCFYRSTLEGAQIFFSPPPDCTGADQIQMQIELFRQPIVADKNMEPFSFRRGPPES